MKKWRFVTLIIMLSSCENYHQNMLEWSDKLPNGLSSKEVQLMSPDYLCIDWVNSDTLENGFVRFYITDIKDHNDVLGMSYFLEFDESGYVGLFAHK